jgi:hypothetical protein
LCSLSMFLDATVRCQGIHHKGGGPVIRLKKVVKLWVLHASKFGPKLLRESLR